MFAPVRTIGAACLLLGTGCPRAAAEGVFCSAPAACWAWPGSCALSMFSAPSLFAGTLPPCTHYADCLPCFLVTRCLPRTRARGAGDRLPAARRAASCAAGAHAPGRRRAPRPGRPGAPRRAAPRPGARAAPAPRRAAPAAAPRLQRQAPLAGGPCASGANRFVIRSGDLSTAWHRSSHRVSCSLMQSHAVSWQSHQSHSDSSPMSLR